MADRHMRSLIKAVPDGVYQGTAILEDAGHGFGDFEITANVTIKKDTCHIAIEAPARRCRISSIPTKAIRTPASIELMMFTQFPPPYQRGAFPLRDRRFRSKRNAVQRRRAGTAHELHDDADGNTKNAVRLAFEKAVPSKVSASWGHANGFNIAHWTPRTNEEYVTMVLATIISGAAATPQQDGWHACGPECSGLGALTSGDVELLEYSYPIVIHRYSLIEDFGAAGKYRGGSGTAWRVEPLDREMTFITFGEGRRIPAVGAAGAVSKMIDFERSAASR